jgi:hypothetical protein
MLLVAQELKDILGSCCDEGGGISFLCAILQ